MAWKLSDFALPARVEQATAAPGELRDVDVPYDQRCWKSVADDTMARCRLRIGHAGECEAPDAG